MNDTTQVVANFDKTVDQVSMKFRFKKDKLGNQRPSFEIQAHVPSVEGIIQILQTGGKGLEYLQELLAAGVRDAIAVDVGDNESFNQDTYNSATITINGVQLHKYSWEAIANAPREDRRSIAAEVWEGFAADYVETMVASAGKTKEQAALATTVYLKKFAQVKTNKEIVSKLKDQLGIYMETSKKAEEYSDVLDLLLRKADALLKADEAVILAENLF